MDHSFDIEHAKKYGVIEAIIIKHFIFWIGKNKADGKNFMDGKTWSYNSVKGFEAIFPYFTKKQIWNALNNLKDVGVLATGNYNKTSFDKTLWYAFMEEEMFISHIKVTQVVDFSDFPSRENRYSPQGKSNIHTRKMDFPPGENGVSLQGKPIPDNLPDNKTDNLPDKTNIPSDTPKDEASKPKHEFAEDVDRVFDHWRVTMESPGSKLDAKRKTAIKKQLKAGYTVDQLCVAITGCSLTPHNMGQNDNDQKYNGLSLILRDAEQIDRFTRNALNPPNPKTGDHGYAKRTSKSDRLYQGYSSTQKGRIIQHGA